jgi:hypothetical protein
MLPGVNSYHVYRRFKDNAINPATDTIVDNCSKLKGYGFFFKFAN